MEKIGTMMSLFSGSGTFEKISEELGIEPKYNAEIEPYPIKVTQTRFPNTVMLGDVTEINGAEIEPVDLITFGSPCQDLSIGGKREGLKHKTIGDDENTRSGLFMEAIRIIREMREKTNGKYPTYIVWENVPGAFSSNNGEDFRIVLQELEKTATGKDIVTPRPANGWTNGGSILGGTYSIAWRTLDSQYWGVPQRRKRIYLVADFGGERAEKILFERGGLLGDIETSGT